MWSYIVIKFCLLCTGYARITTISSTPSTTTFKPLVEKTRCEKQREEILSKRLLGAFIPKCTSDGEFEIIQCHGEMGQCWCVDESGKEIGGSRTPEGSKPDCEPEGMLVCAAMVYTRILIAFTIVKMLKLW